MPLFSIIVPVYNAETYLRECVDSVITQSFSDWELILVNDMSPDTSARIMEEYTTKDPRIKSVHLDENVGVSGARNTGIHASSGKYLLFLDSDDFFAAGSLEKLADIVVKNPDADIIFLSFYFYRTSKKSTYRHIIPDIAGLKSLSGEAFLLKIVRDGCCIPQPGTKMIKADFLKNNEYIFQKGIHAGEDAEWTYRLISKSANYAACNHPHYMYRFRKGSLSTSRNALSSWAESVNRMMFSWAPVFADKNMANRKSCLCLMARNYAVTLALWRVLPEEMKEKYGKMLREYSWVLKHSDDYKTRLTRIAYSLFGFKITSKLLFEYMRYTQRRARE